jgi:glyoxylase-like metal-dependent hydrolase (beta-lactamase superfamily II)
MGSWHRAAAATFLTAPLLAHALDALVPIKVTPNVYYVQGKPGVASAANEGFNSNAGFVVTREGVVVIDALGTPALGEALIRAIRTLTASPIKRLILTHYHADHYYGAVAFRRAGIEIWAHRSAQPYLDSGAAGAGAARPGAHPWVDEACPSSGPTAGSTTRRLLDGGRRSRWTPGRRMRSTI